MSVSKLIILISLSLILGMSSCKKDQIFEELPLEGNYYEPGDSSGFATIQAVQVKQWGINLAGDTVSLEAIISIQVPEEFFNNSNLFDPSVAVTSVFYLNGVAHPVKYQDGVYTFNNFFRLMKDKDNTLALFVKLTDSANELRRVSNTYVFRVN